MIIKKEFYFVRHGQTDHNILEGTEKGNHPEDISINETGRNQARLIEPIISNLPIISICASPLKRVQETKSIISSNLQINTHYTIDDLGECSADIWNQMRILGMYTPLPDEGNVRHFMDRVKRGLNQALSFPGPSLIVAHGGIHWAICCLAGIVEHEWAIDNCVPVHFHVTDQGNWTAKKLI